MAQVDVPTVSGDCVVCRQSTTTRCSKCGQAGLDWMYFCSTDHQKLLWPAHKRICGRNPFEWPALSQSEVDQYITLSTKQTPATSYELTSWLGTVAEAAGLPVSQIQPQFKSFIQEMGPPTGNKPLSRSMSAISVQTRSNAFSTRAKSTFPRRVPDHAEGCALASSNPIELLAYVEHKLVQKLATDFADAPWASDFHHKFLIYNYLLSICEPGKQERIEYANKAADDLRGFVEKEMMPTHPDEAGKVLPSIGMLMMGPFPVYKGE